MNIYGLGLSGRSKSGKTTLARSLARTLDGSLASFGDYVRKGALSEGLEPTREDLQAVGTRLIESGWEPFCRAVLSEAGWNPGQFLVVDGIRHLEALEHVRKLIAPIHLFHIHIQIDDQTRAKRVGTNGAHETFESHPIEQQVQTTLPRYADLIVDGVRPVDDLVSEITGFAQRHLN